MAQPSTYDLYGQIKCLRYAKDVNTIRSALVRVLEVRNPGTTGMVDRTDAIHVLIDGVWIAIHEPAKADS